MWYNSTSIVIKRRVGQPHSFSMIYERGETVGRRKVVDVISDITRKFCVSTGLELVDVQFVKEGPHRYLRVIIDKEDGVNLDDCGNVSKYLNKKLDDMDLIEEQYFLEVTSPGVERELKRDEDFIKYSGKMVQAKLFQPVNGLKVIKGKLLGVSDDGKICIENEKEENIQIPKSKTAVVKLVVDFDKEDN